MAGSKTNGPGPRRYPKGERRREEIIAVAAEVYADAGYQGASLREIAKRIGMTHAGLLYHFPSREALLTAVLERRDEQDAEREDLRGPATLGALGHLVELAGYNQRHSAIVELYVRLAAEAIAEEHPAHDYFTRHYARARKLAFSSFAALSEAGQLRPGVDPKTAAVTFIALMDGLQVQWLTSPEEVDLAGPLRFLLEHLLTVPLG
jgi:AcrR family transcriptional regulator